MTIFTLKILFLNTELKDIMLEILQVQIQTLTTFTMKLEYKFLPKAPASRTSTVWQTFQVLPVTHNVCQFGHHTNMYLTNIFCWWQAKNVLKLEKQSVPVTQCLSWWPNTQACLRGKIQNVCQAMIVRLAGA